MTAPPIPAIARPKLSSRARVQTDKLTGKPVLLYPEGALMLNPTAHVIVSLCNGTVTVSEIVTHLAGHYHVSTAKISGQVAGFLDRLRAKNLLDLA